MSLKNLAEEYFSNLNSIASRLCSDLKETQSSYEELWSTLTDKEQQDILSDSIIKPEISVKYSSKEEDTKTYYAVKLIFDDHYSYRDEHSGPFTFRTQSQRDLSIFQTDKPKGPSNSKTRVFKPKLKPVSVIHQEKEKELIREAKREEILKDNPSNEEQNILPKTGLDFLDNW